jgi:hypothetical protein
MKYLIKIILCTLLATSFMACNKQGLKDLNIDPQSLPSIDLNFIFTSVELGAAASGSSGDNRYTDWRTNIGLASMAIQQVANAGGGIAPGDKYQDNPESSNAPFEHLYGDQLKNVATILRETDAGGFAEGKNKNLRQATRIIRAFLFSRLTDYYGSIPYFEALKATEGILFPKYDKQKAIYADLFKELEEAVAGFGPADPTDGFAAADLYYNGDLTKWKKWANSLMLRFAMRLSNVDAATANTYVAKAVAGGVFTSNADNVIVPMATGPSQWIDQNGISRAFYPGDGGQPIFLSKTLIDWLKGANPAITTDDDPRLFIFTGGIGKWTVNGGQSTWTPSNTDALQQKGMPNGYDLPQLKNLEANPNLDPDLTYSKINTKLLDLDDPYMLMNYGEVELMLAEAAQRGIGGLTPAQAAAHYNAGVKASMQMYSIYNASLTVSDAQVAAYLATYPYGVAKPALEMIGEQYWANHFLNWWEAWSNWRRTSVGNPKGYPQLTPTNYAGNVTGGTIPQRLKYQTGEVAGNPNFAATATTPDTYTTKVWWAGGPE